MEWQEITMPTKLDGSAGEVTSARARTSFCQPASRETAFGVLEQEGDVGPENASDGHEKCSTFGSPCLSHLLPMLSE